MHTGKERLIVTNKNEICPRYVCMYLYDIDMYTYMSRYGANKDLALVTLVSQVHNTNNVDARRIHIQFLTEIHTRSAYAKL